MSATARHDADNRTTNEPTMFAEGPIGPPAAEPPQLPNAAREAALDAVERALAASVRLRHALPPTPRLDEPGEPPAWLRPPLPAGAGEAPARRLRARPSLDPVRMAVPPGDGARGTSAGRILAWVTGAVTLAALAALLVVGAVPLPFGGAGDDAASAASLWSRIVPDRRSPPPPAEPAVVAPAPAASPDRAALVERFVALRQPQPPAQPSTIVPQAVKVERVVMPAQPAPPPPNLRALDRDEIAVLAERSRALIEQGDIASARLMLTRAAEAGDAASALALGTTYDPDALRKLGVIGVAADPKQAHAWYTRAVALGSAEATLRLDRLAQAAR